MPIVLAGTVTSTTSLQGTPFFTKMRTGALYRGMRILAGKPCGVVCLKTLMTEYAAPGTETFAHWLL
jgi:hypothetical protein